MDTTMCFFWGWKSKIFFWIVGIPEAMFQLSKILSDRETYFCSIDLAKLHSGQLKFLTNSKIWLISTSLFASSYKQIIFIAAFDERENYVAQWIVAIARNPVKWITFKFVKFW